MPTCTEKALPPSPTYVHSLVYGTYHWYSGDTKDLSLRKNENSFLLGPVLVYTSTVWDQDTDYSQSALPKGIWLSFDFDDSHPDIPALYLQGGAIIPLGPPHQHVGEARPSDDLSLIVALDEHGKAKGVLYEDDGDGYGFTEGHFLLTHYVAELQSSVVTVGVSKTEGSWKRPNRRLHVQLLLGGGAMVDAWGTDGEALQIKLPSEQEVSELVSASMKQCQTRLENAKRVPNLEDASEHKGTKLSRTPIELKGGDWVTKVVPWIGGRIISMMHIPSELIPGELRLIPTKLALVWEFKRRWGQLWCFGDWVLRFGVGSWNSSITEVGEIYHKNSGEIGAGSKKISAFGVEMGESGVNGVEIEAFADGSPIIRAIVVHNLKFMGWSLLGSSFQDP
ncbi:hypothetical protein L484_022714 [Morus notabilis]|uniref:DUF5110 domain-containing protein n=1 Tax=Morus notabilis TaxID=981085 RepID=W9SMK1_9ROSA|nr:hypothetical protein L484_022714 [Morus notabilis]